MSCFAKENEHLAPSILEVGVASEHRKSTNSSIHRYCVPSVLRPPSSVVRRPVRPSSLVRSLQPRLHVLDGHIILLHGHQPRSSVQNHETVETGPRGVRKKPSSTHHTIQIIELGTQCDCRLQACIRRPLVTAVLELTPPEAFSDGRSCRNAHQTKMRLCSWKVLAALNLCRE